MVGIQRAAFRGEDLLRKSKFIGIDVYCIHRRGSGSGVRREWREESYSGCEFKKKGIGMMAGYSQSLICSVYGR